MKKTTKHIALLALCMAAVLALAGCLTTEETQTQTGKQQAVYVEPNVPIPGEIPYNVDLSRFPSRNDNKTAIFDRATNTVTIQKENANIYHGLNNLDITKYNILRIKYKAVDYGFFLVVDYDDASLDWTNDKMTYCPSYLTEMIIPLKNNQKRLSGICVQGTWGARYQQFVIESVTLEKVDNPQKTDVYASDEPPVIDRGMAITISGKTDAWDFVKQLGAGLNYQVFENSPFKMDFGMDVQPQNGISKPTKEQIQFLKQKGFKTIRLQTNPNLGGILDENYTLNPMYIKQIKQVIDWCIEEDMYVILCGSFSEHMGFDEFKRRAEAGDKHFVGFYLNEKKKKESTKLIEAVWKQYAQAFNNSYDEHLIFETLNEPVDMLHEWYDGHDGWTPKSNCSACKKAFSLLNEYNQLIVNTIRATGGNNANRFIIVEGIAGNWKNITDNLFNLPADTAWNKLIPTLHEYPMGPLKVRYNDYYTESIKATIKEEFDALDKTYFSKHIPVYVGEISNLRYSPIMERINCIKDFMAEVTKPDRSCTACFHNDGDIEGTANYFGYYDSWNLKWYDEEYIDTFIYAAEGKVYPLSADFIKKNEVKFESIVGKNLLTEPKELKDWKNGFSLENEIFVRSVPAKYKFELEIEKKGSTPILMFGYHDKNWKFIDFSKRSDVKVTGAVKGNNFEVRATTVTITINEELASLIEDSNCIWIDGQQIIIKSVKVVE
ncbi:MAG: glycoside hydrolase family 5 protein [Spirochaetaceae bacterium]|nr:glycoside hydrolase family 5 protein [Spirochaetaceae bacterium]